MIDGGYLEFIDVKRDLFMCIILGCIANIRLEYEFKHWFIILNMSYELYLLGVALKTFRKSSGVKKALKILTKVPSIRKYIKSSNNHQRHKYSTFVEFYGNQKKFFFTYTALKLARIWFASQTLVKNMISWTYHSMLFDHSWISHTHEGEAKLVSFETRLCLIRCFKTIRTFYWGWDTDTQW